VNGNFARRLPFRLKFQGELTNRQISTRTASMKTFLEFKTVSVTISGDYYQVMFHGGLDTDDEPYFMAATEKQTSMAR